MEHCKRDRSSARPVSILISHDRIYQRVHGDEDAKRYGSIWGDYQSLQKIRQSIRYVEGDMEAAHALIEAYRILLNSIYEDNITQIKE